MATPCFPETDIVPSLPEPGYYLAAITSARWRRSAAGNRMAQVVFALDDVPVDYDRVPDYFVVEGTTARGLALARSRLVELFVACGLPAGVGEPIRLDLLAGKLVEVKVDHEAWKGQDRLRITGYRRPGTAAHERTGQLEGQGFLFPPASLSQGGHRA